jgi:hypothetical protein
VARSGASWRACCPTSSPGRRRSPASTSPYPPHDAHLRHWTAPASHRWADAAGERAYLAERYRHLFHFRVELDVGHDDREVEFHDRLDACREITPAGAD